MTITISGTSGISGVAGSVSTPSIVGDDTDTGLWFPAVNTLALSTGGTERLRISSTGVVSTTGNITQNGDQVLDVGGGQTITGGFTITPFNLGNLSGANLTLNAVNGNYQYITNNGAGTINAPTADCAIDIFIFNTTGAGTLTLSGFQVAATNFGDPLTTTTTDEFVISVRRVNSVATYTIKALQ